MCGIAGFVTLEPSGFPEGTLRRMTDALAHRGPDAEGFWNDGRAFLGHRRLSIVDLATGQQPMANEDESSWIIYNGEIYNHADLRPSLERAGHRYKTRCDTEAVLHAYEERGRGCVSDFRGMFAFALWDREARKLFAARDRLGIKPFYYWFDGRVFVFASEIKAILEHPAVSVELEETKLAEHLAFGYSNDDRTLFRGVKRLPPGHTLELGPGGSLSIEPYWSPPRVTKFADRPEREWVEECRARFEDAVRSRLMADVPLGMFLSGGVDSGSVAATLKRITDQPVKTFSVGYAETEYSELGYAADVARLIGTAHREVAVGVDDFFDALPRLIWHEDEPIVWPSSVSLHFVSKLAAEDVKVVLTGEGADEMFAGYGRYRYYLLNQRLEGAYGLAPDALRRGVRRFVATSPLVGRTLRRKVGHTVVGREGGFRSLYVDNFLSAFDEAEQARLLGSKQSAAGAPYEAFEQWWESAGELDPLSRLLYTDQRTYLHELLMKQDQMSMSASIESRVPFLDHAFVEFAATIPPALKLKGKTGKYLFKKAAEGLIPNEILHRKKMGFPTPLRQWLREGKMAEVAAVVLRKDSLLGEYCERAELERVLERQRSGELDATDRIWRLLNLQLWGEVFLKKRGAMEWGELAA